MELQEQKQELFQKEVQIGEEMLDYKEALIRPYKSLGVFADDNQFQVYSIAQSTYLLSSTRNAFKLYTLPQLKIQLLSPTFPNKIRAMCAINEFIFVGVKNTIYKMRYYHLISKIELASKVQKMIVLGKFLITLSEGGVITVIEHNKNLIVHTIFTQNNQNNYENTQITDIVHPPTYLNKLLAYGPFSMQIWNIATKKQIFSFDDTLLEDFRERKIEISKVECSPVLDIVAIAFNDGKIYFVDIKENTVLFKVQCQLPAISLSFSKQDPPILACGDEKGNIIMWDLNERKKFCVLKEVHSGCVNSLHFMYDEQMLVSGSGQGNEIFQWKYEEFSDNKFILFRKRNGLKSNITKLRCMDKDHVLACTNYKQTEIREFSLKNECMSQFYSVKQQSQKQMKNSHILTETTIEQNKPVKDFAFSMNRSKDWANVITIHNDTTKPTLFNSEDKTIVKKNVELFKSDDKSEKDSEITCAYVTECGNYGILGFETGKIIKFNLQSGKLQCTFTTGGHSSTVTSVFVNYCNKFLVSSDRDQNMIFWDFYSGQKMFQQIFDDNSILFTRPAKFMDNFIVALTDCTLEIWDLNTQKMGRKFSGHTNKITDACWVSSNKQIISSGMDGLLNIYDILSNQLIQSIQIKNNKYYITSLDIYDDILVTAFNNSRQVFLWHNLIDSLFWNTGEKTKTIEFKSLLKYYSNSRTHFYLANQIKNEEQEKTEDMELELNILEDEDENLIRFTKLESGKWLPLVNIEEIKERNQLENSEKEEIKMPFFLDFENKDKVKQDMQEEIKQKLQQKSKIMTQDKEKYLVELDKGIEQIFIKYDKSQIINGTHKQMVKISETFLEFLSQLNYTQVDYEMRRYLFGNVENIKILVEVFLTLFDSQTQTDLKGVYFNNFIKICSYDLINLPELLEKMQEIQNKMKNQTKKLDNRVNYIKCLAENFANIPN